MRHFDVAGAISVTSGLIVLVYAIVKSIDWGWGSRDARRSARRAALLAAFVAIERALARAAGPPRPLPDALPGDRQRRDADPGRSGMFAMFFFCTLYLQNVLGYSALETGVAFLPISAGIVIGSAPPSSSTRGWAKAGDSCTGLALAAAGLALLACHDAGRRHLRQPAGRASRRSRSGWG